MSGEAPRTFIHHVRVPYAHVDQMGFVYYAHYYVYFEMARSELLREAGMPYGELEERGVMLPVVESHCEYKRAATFDDLLEIRTQCTRLKGTRLRIEYDMRRGDEPIVVGYTDHVCMNPSGRVMRPVPELKALVEGAG